jgi:predicted dehydrogenase
MKPLRIGIIGVGDVAQRDYLPEIHRLAGRIEIAAVCGRRTERVRRVADLYQVSRWSTDYREVLDSEIDAVINLTPAESHFEITRAALHAGRHVYTEKPLGMTPTEARTLATQADERELVLVCAPSIMLFPQIQRVRDIVASGELGEIYSARAQTIGGPPPWAGFDSDPTPYFRADTGPLVDLAVYPLHVLTGLLGPVRRVAAMARRTREEFTVAEGTHHGRVVAIESPNQWKLILELGRCVASVETGFATAASSGPECELRGEHGTVACSLLDVASPIAMLGAGGGWRQYPVEHQRASGPDHILGVEHLIDCIASKRTPTASAAHATHVVDVIDAARRSATSGCALEIERPPTLDGLGSPATGVAA